VVECQSKWAHFRRLGTEGTAIDTQFSAKSGGEEVDQSPPSRPAARSAAFGAA
jgi:hypothetical protein